MFRSHVIPAIGALVLLYALASPFLGPTSDRTVMTAPSVPDLPVAFSRDALGEMSSRGPSPANSFRVPIGTPVRILFQSPLSAEVQLADGRHGWVFAEWIAVK